MQPLTWKTLTAAAGVKIHGGGGGLGCLMMTEVKDPEQGTGSRAAFGHTPFAQDRVSKHSSTQLPTPAQHTAFRKKELAMSMEHTAMERNPCVACGQKQWVCFASQPLTTMSLTFHSCPKPAEFPQKPHSKYQCFHRGVVHFHTYFSCDLPNHVQGDPKTGVRKESSSSPRAFQETAQP